MALCSDRRFIVLTCLLISRHWYRSEQKTLVSRRDVILARSCSSMCTRIQNGVNTRVKTGNLEISQGPITPKFHSADGRAHRRPGPESAGRAWSCWRAHTVRHTIHMIITHQSLDACVSTARSDAMLSQTIRAPSRHTCTCCTRLFEARQQCVWSFVMSAWSTAHCVRFKRGPFGRS